MSNSDPSSESTSFGERMGIAMVAFMRALVRLLIIAFLAVVIGAGLYFGLPAIYERYVQPIQMDVSSLQISQDDQKLAIEQLSGRVEDLSARINTLEVQADSDKQSIAELQTQLDNALSTQAENLLPIQNAQSAATARLDELDRVLQSLDDQLSSMNTDVGNLNTTVSENQEQLTGLADRLQIEGTPLETIRNELKIVKAMELLTRGRLLLVANNLGLAQQDLQSAGDLLNELQASLPDDQQEDLAEIIDRLDKASSNLPQRPLLASDDLEIAWRLLLLGLPDQVQNTTAGDTLEVSVTPTPTP
jgi:chaperonin cofactor prefoldin